VTRVVLDADRMTGTAGYDTVVRNASSIEQGKPMRKSKPISVTLGAQQASLERRLKSGGYQSASEVLRHALRALDREEALLDEALGEQIKASMRDRRASVPASEVFQRLRMHHGRRMKAAKRGP
jgi:antitoxin ParD1/3/4